METLGLIVVAVVGVIVLIQIVGALGRRNLRQSAFEWLKSTGHDNYKTAFGPGDAVGFDYEKRTIAVSTSNGRKVLPFESLISVELCEDGSTVTKTNRGSQLVGAAVGAAAFGGVGAIIGGLSGSSTSREKVSRVTINLLTNDPDAPFIEIKAFDNQPVPKSGFIYRQTMSDITPWFGRLKAIVESN